jgi:hypothetical protein
MRSLSSLTLLGAETYNKTSDAAVWVTRQLMPAKIFVPSNKHLFMGYWNRRRRRKCAEYILSKLLATAPEWDLYLTGDDWYGRFPNLLMEQLATCSRRYSLPDLKRATRLLETNQHISIVNAGNPIKPNNKACLILTLEGKDAFLDGFYKQADRQDLLQEFEAHFFFLKPVVALFKK